MGRPLGLDAISILTCPRLRLSVMTRCLPLLLLVFIPPVFLMASDGARDGKSLIEGAEARANIFGLPSFQMAASVRIDNKGSALEGSYLLLWNGPEQWREEIRFPGYSEVQVGGKGIVFIQRTTDFIPLAIYQLHSALGYGSGILPPGSFSHLIRGPDETVKKIHSRKINAVKADCVEVAGPENHTREICVDIATGALVRQNPFVDREVTPVSTKLFPHFLSYMEEGKSIAEVHITDLRATEPLPSASFDPPRGAVSKPGCMNPNPPRLVRKVQPRYPEPERQSHLEGTVAIDTTIGKDGNTHNLRVVSGTTSGFNNASLEATRLWHYEPATCDGVAIDLETILTVNYHLQ